MNRRALLPLLLTLLVLSGCSAETLHAFAIQPATYPGEPAGNRIVVEGLDGNLFTVHPDGSRRIKLTSDAGPTRDYRIPTWSPDATSVAAARTDFTTGRSANALVNLAQDGSGQTESPAPYAPFFISWNKSGQRIAYLSNWESLDGPSIALRMVDVAANSVDTIAAGSPYYFSWSPDGNQLFAHIGSNRLELQDSDGVRSSFLFTGADFSSPQWASSGDKLVYATRDDGVQQVVIGDVNANPLTTITEFDNRISFSLSPDGRSLAYVLSPSQIGATTFGPLYVADVDTLATRELSTEPVWAYFWSPDGTKLAWVSEIWQDTGPALHWTVWDGTKKQSYPAFIPSRTYLQRFLYFSDQFAQSMQVWSPQSDALVYAARMPGRRSVIAVQALDEAEPQIIAPGIFAAWSPR